MREDDQLGAGANGPASAGNRHNGGSAAGPWRSPVPPGSAERLGDIQSITDAALSVLEPQALLDVLVERVKEAMQADTAAILLLDHPFGQLVATAASGLEEEVQQGVRIPLGNGFAGRIAAQGHPVVLEEVDHTKVVNPILLDKGIRSLMGAPLRADGTVIGVLHVGTLSPHTFTNDDVDLLQLAADRAALAVQALAAQVDRAATEALQRSLVPTALPAVRGLEMGARYRPGHRGRLEAAGYLTRGHIGRRNRYTVNPDSLFRHSAQGGLRVGPFLDLLAAAGDASAAGWGSAAELDGSGPA